MKWKVTSPDGEVNYYSPDDVTLVMGGCKLRNYSGTAQKIHDGANKTVCAWVEAEAVDVYNESPVPLQYSIDLEVLYNPRRTPHWTYYGDVTNIDNKEINLLVTNGRRLWDIGWIESCDDE